MTFHFNAAHPKFLSNYPMISLKFKKAITVPKICSMFSPKKAPPRKSAMLSSLHAVRWISLTGKHVFKTIVENFPLTFFFYHYSQYYS